MIVLLSCLIVVQSLLIFILAWLAYRQARITRIQVELALEAAQAMELIAARVKELQDA